MAVGGSNDADVIVIGGGPAGSTAASVLARHGRRVLVFEKEKFPRYHIGESLLPFCYPTFERIGVLEKMKASRFVKKYSVQFVRMDGHQSLPFYFFKRFDHPLAQTWQVTRSLFDQLLLDHSRESGAVVHEETAVRELIHEDGQVRGVRVTDATGSSREYRAPMTIDASGRDSVAHLKAGWRMRDPKLNKIAVWTYYRGAKRDTGYDEGATTVAYLPGKGWFWYIPLEDDVISVGVVAEKDYLFRDGVKDLEVIFQRCVLENRWIQDHLEVGKQFGPYRVTGEYSYRSRYSAVDGLVMAGDAFAFLDPVFSSGVFLALKTGELAADAVHEALAAGDVSASRFSAYSETACQGIESMRRLVYAFYDPAFSFRAACAKGPEISGRFTDCLSGDLFRDYDDLYSVVSEFAEMPSPLPHGRPLLKAS
jgi:flavin-dependent dehydrogenase